MMSQKEKSVFSRGPDLLALPSQSRRLRMGIVGGGRISKVQSLGMRLSDRWEVSAGAFSTDRDRSAARGREWYLPQDRIYTDYRQMAEVEAGREDGIDAVTITTPNDSHYDIAREFAARGFHVFCEKPMTTSVETSLELVAAVRSAGIRLCVAHAYAGHAMVRQAREMIRSGSIGRVRQVHVEYAQEWMLGEEIQSFSHVKWRQDPARSGGTACTADIGTHAHHLAAFVSGLEMTRLRAELLVCGPLKQLDDTVYVNARFEGDVPGLLWASQVAAGNFVGLRFRIYGDTGGLEWDQEKPDFLYYSKVGQPAQVVRRGYGGGNSDSVERLTRAPAGNAEGWLEAWANVFAEFAADVAEKKGLLLEPPVPLFYATVEDGARGAKFVEAAVTSDRAGGAWTNCQIEF
jgi:predicted dehydrogenase